MGIKGKIITPKIIVIVAFFLIVAGIAGFVVYQRDQAAKLEAAYQEAIVKTNK